MNINELKNLKNRIIENIVVPKQKKDKTILFERMDIREDVNGGLPPGFSQDDILPISSIICGSEGDTEISEDSPIQPIELGGGQAKLNRLFKDRPAGIPNKKGDPMIHNKTLVGHKDSPEGFAKGIVDETGKEIDPEKLKQFLMIKPPIILNQNTKMGKSDIWSTTLPKYMGIFYDEKADEFKVVRTCPNAKDCVKDCYAGKGGYAMFPRSTEKSAQSLNYLLNHWEEWKKQIIGEIRDKEMVNDARGIDTIIRWHDSGDFMSEKYLELVLDIARETPEVTHYAYTKEVGLTQGREFPENFIIRHSFGGQEDLLIDRAAGRYSDIIEKDEFKPYVETFKVGKDTYYKYRSKEAEQGLKQAVANKHGLDVNTMLTYPEFMKTNQENDIPKWNVIVTPSNGDEPAFRKDVAGVYLLKH